MTRSICFIIALAMIFTSMPISIVAMGPRLTAKPASAIGRDVRYNLTKATVAAARLNTVTAVLHIENGDALIDPLDVFLGGVRESVQILEELNRYEVALVR